MLYQEQYMYIYNMYCLEFDVHYLPSSILNQNHNLIPKLRGNQASFPVPALLQALTQDMINYTVVQ